MFQLELTTQFGICIMLIECLQGGGKFQFQFDIVNAREPGTVIGQKGIFEALFSGMRLLHLCDF